MEKAEDDFEEEEEEEEKEDVEEPKPESGPQLLTSIAEDEGTVGISIIINKCARWPGYFYRPKHKQ